MLAALQGSIVGVMLLLRGRGPAARTREERIRDASAEAAAPVPAEAAAPASDDDWVPPPHAVPFGPFLALGALEFLLAREALARVFFGALEKLAA
jgi:leader peptidase (prepilin peptidase)/N-methyltransferase